MSKQSPQLQLFTDELLAKCNFASSTGLTETQRICGVSGGPDSIALLWLAQAAGLSPIATHVDHKIRNESEADFVAEIAANFGTEFLGLSAEVEPGSNLEQRARTERHQLLGPDAMLGHTVDDQAETVLINLFRGAGPAGLAGIEKNHRHPILSLRREETHKLCDLLEVEPFADPSNANTRFVRNRIRHELMPLIDEISKRDSAPLFARTAERSAEVVEFLDDQIQDVDPTSTKALQAMAPLIRNHALRKWLRDSLGHPPSTAELDRVNKVVSHKVIACELSGGRKLSRTNSILRLE